MQSLLVDSLMTDVLLDVQLDCSSVLHDTPALANIVEPRIFMHLFAGKLAGVPVRVLVDTGATHDFVDDSFASRTGLFITSSGHTNASVAGGSTIALTGEVRATLALGKFSACISPLAMVDMHPDADLILGLASLKKFHFVLRSAPDSSLCLLLRKGTRSFTLHSVPDIAPTRPVAFQNFVLLALRAQPVPTCDIISAKAARRDVKKGAHSILILVKKETEVSLSTLTPVSNSSVPIQGPGLIPEPILTKIIDDYEDVFQEPPAGSQPDRDIGHTIELLPGSQPVFRSQYRLSPLELEEVKKQVAHMLRLGFIEPSKSPFGSPILFVAKKTGGLRMVVDYRALNKLTIKNRYPLPRIDDLLDKVAGCSAYSSIDLYQAYHQLKISPEDVPKTAFRTPVGHYQFRVLIEGLTNAPATFQMVMNRLFSKYIDDFIVVYLDDICVFSKNGADHEQHLRLVLDILRKEKLYARREKCVFNKPEALYLGHIVSKSGVRVDPKKTAVVRDWVTPRNPHEVRQFLGLSNYFRKFIQGYSTLVTPMINLCKDTVPWLWSPECQSAFDGVKHSLVCSTALRPPDFTKPFEVIADASLHGIGAVLVQEGCPLAFYSRKFIPAEKNYTTGEQELLASVEAMKEWRCYLEGSETMLVTDHQPLTFLQSQPTLSRRQARWAEYLSRFHFTWEHRPGRLNVADPISRNPSLHAVTTRSSAAHTLVQSMLDACQKDPWFKDSLNTNSLQRTSNGLYTKRTLDGRTVTVVPNDSVIRNRILHELHDAQLSGHPGQPRTLEAVKRRFWWPTLARDVESYVKCCPVCQRNKLKRAKPAGLLNPLPIPSEPWESVSTDFISQLPRTPKHGYDAIAVYVDRLTKMVHFRPTKTTITAEQSAELFLEAVFVLHGMPKSIVSDRGSQFANRFWPAFTGLLGSRSVLSTAFHPQTDGQTENMNRTLEDMLRHYVGSNHNDWDVLLPVAEFAVNNSFQSSIGMTPFYLNYGRHPHTPLSRELDCSVPEAGHLADEILSAQVKAKKALLAAQSRQKTAHDKKHVDVQFTAGQQVLLNTRNLKFKHPGNKKLARKLLPKFVGPFPVECMVGKAAVRLTLPPHYRIHNTFHVSLISPYLTDGRVQPPPVTVLDSDPCYTVERVLLHRARKSGRKKTLEFLVKWQGIGPEHNQWIPEQSFDNTEILKTYWALHPDPAAHA